ncbi:MAG TPA: hypothetical protein VFN79_13645 [Steroidobacteraceae bacterium]|nr:hypothetical protein [Steroidobacteraceae bacterium]
MTSRDPMLAVFTALVCLVVARSVATATRDSTGQYVDGAAVTAKAKTALFNDPPLKSWA